jgi:Fe2+ or Zn2+ uptake regulation protein
MTENVSDKVLVGKLRQRGQRVTPQRLVIHRALAARDQHLTAEQLLEAVSGSLPGTSLPTIYATLELFEELGLVRRVSTGSGALLFDSRLTPHAHTVCRACGLVSDIDLPETPVQAFGGALGAGFQAEHTELVIWGRCADCAAPARS